jgi:hypothetical protein
MSDPGNDTDHVTSLVKRMMSADPPEAVQSRLREIVQGFRTDLSAHPWVRKLEARGQGVPSRSAVLPGRLTGARLAAGLLAVAILALGGLTVLNRRPAGVVWAEVADRVAGIDRLMFQLHIGVPTGRGRGPGRGESTAGLAATMTFYLSEADGFRWDVLSDSVLAMSMYVPPGADSVVFVNHEEQTWARLPARPETPAQTPISPGENPEDYIRRFLARGYEELEPGTIEDVSVSGVEVVDPPFGEDSHLDGVGRLWVEGGSQLPVRLELVGRLAGQSMRWLLDFRWGEQVDIEAFTPTIPPGYSPPPGDQPE